MKNNRPWLRLLEVKRVDDRRNEIRKNMKLNIRNKLLLGFAAVLVVTASVAVYTYRSVLKRDETINWVEHTYIVLRQSDQVLQGMINMETGFRGYLLSGEDKFLDPYRAASSSIRLHWPS